jgi:uncharacterized protein (DUF1697 family)
MVVKRGETFVALLRGINVGGKNKLPMKDLVRIFESAGCVDVRHYIQSGNVVLDATAAIAKRLPAMISAAIASELELTVPVVVRSADEMRAVAKTNPLLAKGAAVDSLHVVFLADAPSAAAVASLDPQRSPPDAFVVRGREIYVSCPNGVGNSKLTNAWFDTKLRTISTGRNWRTVLKLVEMCG